MRRLIIMSSLCVLLASACAPATQGAALLSTPAPSPMALQTPDSVTVAQLTRTIAEPQPVTPEKVSIEATTTIQKDAVATQPIDELGQLPPGRPDHVEVVYFHLAERCSGCLEAERLTRKTLDTYFANRLQSGEMSLVVADLQDPQNAALVQKYDAYGPSLYLGIMKDGAEYTWPVNDIWFTVSDEPEFMASLLDKLDTVYYESHDD